MTRSDLIADLAATNPHLRQADIELIVALVFDQIAEALARGQRVELRGFGVFTARQMRARVGRNPRTGKEVPIDERRNRLSLRPTLALGCGPHDRSSAGWTPRLTHSDAGRDARRRGGDI